MSDVESDLTLRYETTRADQVAKLQRYAAESSVARSFPLLSYIAIVALSWTSACLFYIRQGDRNYLYVASAALALFLTLALPWLYRRYQDSFFTSVLTDGNLRGLIGRVELVVEQDGIEERGPISSVRAGWSDIVAVERQSARIFIFVAPLIAIVIPEHAFGSEEEREAFIVMINARIDAGRR